MTTPDPRDSALVRAARGERPDHVPVWFMRQAGRSLPEYRKVREGVPMLESCMRPDLVVEITLQPVRRHGVDAAIFFSDIVLPLKALGVDLDIVPGVGPVIAAPVSDLGGVGALPTFDPTRLGFVTEAVQGLTGELGGYAPDRLRGGALHARVVPDRGRAEPRARPHQGADARGAGRLGRPAHAAGRDLGRVPPGADRGRRLSGAAVRLVGRRAVARGLPAVRAAVLPAGVRLDRRPRRAADPLRGRDG